MERTTKRDFASTSSAQPNPSKRPFCPPINQERNETERNLVLRTCSTGEDVQRMVRVELEHAESQLAKQSYSGIALQDKVQGMDSMENAIQKLVEKQVELAESCIAKRFKKELENFKCQLVKVVVEQVDLAKSQSQEIVGSHILNALKEEVVTEICSSLENTIQRVNREELKRVIPQSADLVKSLILETLKVAPEICPSLEDTSRRVEEEAAEPADCTHLGRECRANAKSTAKNGRFPARNLQLRFRTKLPDPVYTGNILEGEGRTIISVALIDANKGHEVTSGPESSIKLDVVVLDGDFDKDDEDDWAQDEFEKYMVKEREGKRLLLTGDFPVKLKEGVTELRELTFSDNSSWMRRKKFRIGVKVAPGCRGNEQIREGITNAFRVLEHRGKEYEKHHAPRPEEAVWSLKEIGKNGARHQKLREAGIRTVEDFLLQLFVDSKKLAEILGMDKSLKSWSRLVDHTKTSKISWEQYLYYSDGEANHGAIFNRSHQLIGLIKDREYVANHRLSAIEKEHGDEIVKQALTNQNDVRVLNGETFSSSMQNTSSSSFPSQVLERLIDNVTLVVPSNLAPRAYAAPVGPEAPPASAISNAEGHNGVSALPLPAESQNTYSGNAIWLSVDESALATHQPESADRSNFPISRGGNDLAIVQLPVQSKDTSAQYATGSQWINPSSQRDYTLNVHVPPSELPSATISAFPSSSALPVSEGNPLMEGTESTPFDCDTLLNWDNLDLIAALESPSPPDVHTSFPTPPSG